MVASVFVRLERSAFAFSKKSSDGNRNPEAMSLFSNDSGTGSRFAQQGRSTADG
jgi:hypothetical protein